MAKHIKIGQPVNAAESWAFEFLEENLPPEYLLITNVEIPTPTGVLKEVDALVYGKYAIYLVDVKGYTGKLSVDANSSMNVSNINPSAEAPTERQKPTGTSISVK